MITKRICIEGEKVHDVGYRPFLLAKAMRFGLKNFDAENVKENGKQKILISMSGDGKKISEFVRFAKENFPESAKVCDVSDEKSYPETVMPIDEYQKLLSAEQQNKMIKGGLQTGNKTDALKEETNRNFDRMDKKYDEISKGMFDVVTRLEKSDETFGRSIEKIVTIDEERNKAFESRIEKIEIRMEKTDKHIESLLKFLVEQKGQR
jgi:acylphosphatase